MPASIPLTTLGSPSVIKETRSTCPVCLALVPARVVREGRAVRLHKSCPAHGDFRVTLANDDAFYHESHGACGCGPSGCCAPTDAGAAKPADPFEVLSTCIALIEIVDSCNLTCPTCFASSPPGTGADLRYTPTEDVLARVRGVIARKGFIDILQLSGGEPTLHPDFFGLLGAVLDTKEIGYVLINTNAVRVSGDRAFRERLGELRRAKGKFELYVQFDGVHEAGQVELRGVDLRDVRRRAIDLAGALGVPSSLAMAVTPGNIASIGDTVRFGLSRRHVRGVIFQPMFNSGRVPAVESVTLAVAPPLVISVGDIVHAACDQSEGLLTPEDFTPLPCGDPNCHTIGYLLRTAEGVTPISRLVDLASLKGFLKDRVDYRLEDLAKCGCESEPLGDLIKKLELSPDAPFRLFVKPFMDAWTWDQDRIDRCCTHVIRQDGTLDSFCRYYLMGGAAGERARRAGAGGAGS